MSLLSLRLREKKIIGVDVVLRVRCYTEAVKKIIIAAGFSASSGKREILLQGEKSFGGKILCEEIDQIFHIMREMRKSLGKILMQIFSTLIAHKCFGFFKSTFQHFYSFLAKKMINWENSATIL